MDQWPALSSAQGLVAGPVVDDAFLWGVDRRWFVPVIEAVEVDGTVVEVPARVSEGQLGVCEGVFEIASVGHCSESLRFDRDQPLSQCIHS